MYLGLFQELVIREFSFHQLNANLLWPGTFAFAEWLVEHRPSIEGRHCLELGRYFSTVPHPSLHHKNTGMLFFFLLIPLIVILGILSSDCFTWILFFTWGKTLLMLFLS